MVAVGVVELALVHEGVVVCVADAPTGGAGAGDEFVDRLAAAEVERDRDLRRRLRSADLLFHSADVSTDPSTANALDAHAGRVFGALQPWLAPGLLANFAAGDDPNQIARCYDTDTLFWLITLADQYDPDRVLQTGQVARTVPRGA